MTYHSTPIDLFAMATEPWCDNYAAQYGNAAVANGSSTDLNASRGNTYNYNWDDNTPGNNYYYSSYQVSQIEQLPVYDSDALQHLSNLGSSSGSSGSSNYGNNTNDMSVTAINDLDNHNLAYSYVGGIVNSEVAAQPATTSSLYESETPRMAPVTNMNFAHSLSFERQDETLPSATTSSPSDYETPLASPTVARKQQPESRMSQPELFARMGLAHDPDEARARENRVLSLLKSRGFKLGEQTWIRDTSPATRQEIIDYIHEATVAEYGYSKYMIEVVIRRACYHLMQGRLRRIRRAKKSKY